MIRELDYKFPIQPIIDQVVGLTINKRLDLNKPTGEYFNDPWETLPESKNTPLGDVLDSLQGIGQARLLCLESAESYTAHADPDDRIHLAIITNPYSFLVDIDGNYLYHLPADGQLWHMDTGKIHVAANWGPRTRIHLNIRVLLPKLDQNRKTFHIKLIEGDFDWKQLSYTPLMQYINKSVKKGTVTGFKAISDKELYLNLESTEEIEQLIDSVRAKGIKIITNTL